MGNTGYQFLKSTAVVIELLKAVEVENAKRKGLDDQTNFWNVLWRWNKQGRAQFNRQGSSTQLSYCPLSALTHLIGRFIYDISPLMSGERALNSLLRKAGPTPP